MKKIKVRVLGLSYSQSQVGSYVLVLSESKGDRKLPIIIKPNDAQYIALKMEDIKTPRPLTHDLFKSLTDATGAEINEVLIQDMVEGIFYAKLTVSNMIGQYEIDCGIGDAISLAMLYKCPIYVSSLVLDSAGIYMTDSGEVTEEHEERMKEKEEKKQILSVEDPEKMLNKAVENEEFEIASQLRDRINQLKELK